MGVWMYRTLAALLPLLCCSEVRGDCGRLDSCSCQDYDTGKVVSLSSLASRYYTAAMSTSVNTSHYLYNPCLPFTAQWGTECNNNAMCETDDDTSYANLGYQDTAEFVTAGNDLYLEYTGTMGDRNIARHTQIQLICDMNARVPNLTNIPYPTVGEYRFTLRSQCACPGACEHIVELCTPDGSNCSCRLGNEGDLIRVQSLSNPDSPIVVVTEAEEVTLSVCLGVDVGPDDAPCRDVAVCLQQHGGYQDYGVPYKALYTVQDGFVVLTYMSLDDYRRTNIRLICDQDQQFEPDVVIRGKPSSTELNLDLRSVCACRNGCLKTPVACERVDDCSCYLADGTGTVSLTDLDNPDAPIRTSSADKWNTYDYYYNPCTNMSVPGFENCTSIAACQSVRTLSENFNLGLQPGVRFSTSLADSRVMRFHYKSETDERQTFIQLKCNATRESPLLQLVQESPVHSYHMTLECRECCFQPRLPSDSSESHPH